jgi:Flp pilus assembly protein TadB
MVSDNSSLAPITRVSQSSDDWPTLLGKLLQDFTRVLQDEVKLLAASVEPGLETAVVRSLNYMIFAVIGLCGVICLIAAMVPLLHTWLEWWQAFGVTGAAMVPFVIVSSRMSRHQKV